MTPDTAKHKCKNFLATLQRLAEEQPPAVAENVRNLIQGLIDGVVDPETFTTKLQRELNSSPQPCLVPFLKRSLPFLQNSLLTGELSIDGVRPPPRTRTMAMTTIGGSGGIVRNVTTVVRPPTVALPTRPVASVMRSMGPNPLIRTQTITNNSVLPNRMLGMQPQPQTTVNRLFLPILLSKIIFSLLKIDSWILAWFLKVRFLSESTDGFVRTSNRRTFFFFETEIEFW